MVKKGKEKAAAPPPKASASSSKKPAKSSNSKPPPEDDFIVFTNSTKDPKPKTCGQGSSKGKGVDDEQMPTGPPKPTVKQIIGGSSWTGKLPVNLLSEHCQRQKWDKPDYQPMKGSQGFSYFVQLSARNQKTKEVVKVPPFKIHPDYKHLVTRETALEARHAAATYALFRVCSMKNIHTTLPPDYRSLWKEFQAIKVEDVKNKNGWMYDADPFAALKQREDDKAAAEKKRKEKEAIEAKAKNMPGAAGLVLRSNAASASGSGGGGNPMKGWTAVPKIEMGRKTRSQLEDLVRREVIWNPHGVQMPPSQKGAVLKELAGSGFRQSHVEEAVDECKDREETLEWLLVHVPEDDLPRWALPESYAAGVSVAALSDLKREAAVKRLSQSGYAAELCKKLYEEHGQDEGRTAEALQDFLLSSGSDLAQSKGVTEEPLIFGTPEECWSDEMESLSSVFGDHFTRVSDDVCQIRIESVKNGPKKNIETFAQFRRSSRYPSEVIVSLVSDLPSYIKLSVVKKTLGYLVDSLSEEPMKIYFAIDWIQQNINHIIEKPGKLRDISGVASAAAEIRQIHSIKQRQSRHPKSLPQGIDARSRENWQKRQESSDLKQMIRQRQKLPAWQVRDQVVQTVLQSQVTIIAGETGSGKSTQSVQFILDDLYNKGLGNATNIICTQPRRISALGLADRVSEERCSQVGKEVGYTIRGENKTSKETKITFVTTGVLLRRLQTSGGQTQDVVASLADVSHIVIDEVHERSLDTDFLLSIIRDVLKQRRDLKLVLMSATLDAATFKNYFTSEGLQVGLVEISGRTFPVQDYYLDDVIKMTNFTVDDNRYRDRGDRDEGPLDGGSNNAQDPINKIIQKLGSRINYSLLVETTKAIDEDLHYGKDKGGILIFLPGVAEINRAVSQLKAISSLHVLPLHASLETREQRKVFTNPPPGKRKVVVATNVAETSITIDDIVAVIDTGRVKETSFDPQNNMRKLEETWASRAACKQRRGRAGRVQAGQCYKLYTESLEERMAERPEPEIRRVPLEQLCLSVRAMGTRDIGGFLSRTPTPPAVTAVENAVKMLQRMGALDGDELTALGQQLAMIPADLRCGKLMVYGAIFGCLDESITIAAILSTKSPFLSPPDKRDLAREARMRFTRGDGDLLTDLRAYQEWSAMVDQGTPQRQVRSFCDENFLSYNTLSDISSTRTQYYSALIEIGIATRETAQTAATSIPLLRALSASAFTPQIARIQFPDKKFAASMSGAVELDPEARTIKYFTHENGRVFIHPSSALFGSQGFTGGAAFVSYFTMISTSKIFIRDLTPFNAFTLLLFSGAIELDTLGRGLVVDGWLRLRGWARIGVLVSRLRGMVDNVIAMKVNNPHMDVRNNEVIRMAAKLIEFDGLDA
ncbi:DEAD/DEAH box helicase [Hypoxylon argillaceum]|nr:DEAD/DEAH box helicase [Hypoxylon argillaceum]